MQQEFFKEARVKLHNGYMMPKRRSVNITRNKVVKGAQRDDSEELFTCPICRKVLVTPVTADCGHTFCFECLDKVNKNYCFSCNKDIGPFRCTNILVQDIVTKWREHSSNENIDSITKRLGFDKLNEHLLTTQKEHNHIEPTVILGIEPRYCLRSRNAGLQTDFNLNKPGKCRISPYKSRHKEQEWYHKKRSRIISKNDSKENTKQVKIPLCDIKIIPKHTRSSKEKSSLKSWKHIPSSDFDCILCSRCFLDPITTNCGHTFCRGCLARVIDHGLACPLCMAPLNPAEESKGATLVIENALSFLAPHEYHQRLVSNLLEIRSIDNGKVPVFVCTNAFPGVACPLYVYEPRYRLLARRCLQSKTRRFAMVSRTDTPERLATFGTILEVKDAVHLQDGTSILTTVGVRRFKVIEKGEQDGYDTATVQYIKDNIVKPERMPELLTLHRRVYNKAAKWVKSLAPRVLAEVENCIGKMPPLEDNWFNLADGPAWAWWLMPILPLSSKLQIGFLYTTDLEKRLRAIDKLLEHMKVKMKALKRNTLKYNDAVENADSCRLSFGL